ncbi:macrophage mannose receptor 1-like [Asterias amurensis]|uniref:macrophage mannose receptor 1-like n=1 Tax=Asterias amurensis TaxID=7602 RepID=UPI003AB2E574
MAFIWMMCVSLNILLMASNGEAETEPTTNFLVPTANMSTTEPVTEREAASTPVSCSDIHGDSFGDPGKPGVCYLFLTDTKRYFLDARTACQRLNDSLEWDVADIEDDTENKIIQNAINVSTSTANEFWIGQNDMATEGVWRYLNASAANPCDSPVYLNWRDGQPDGDRRQNCMVYFYDDGGNFQDRECDDKYDTICKVKITSDTIPTCSPEFKPDTSTAAPDECQDVYYFAFGNPEVPGVCYASESYMTFTFDSAVSFCSTFLDGSWSLADIEDEVENTFLEVWNRDTFPNNNGYWIGQNDRQQEDVWRYTASTQCPVYHNWDTQQPNGGREQNCMVMLKRSSGRFQDKACNGNYNALCKFKKDPGTTDPTSNCSSVDPQMEECTKLHEDAFGSSVKPGICYLMTGNRLPWQMAVDECKGKGGSLIDVEDQTENDLIAARHRDFRPSQVNHWLGQNDRAVEWTWQYLNATPTCSGVFLNWDNGQPNGEATQNCIMMYKNGLWHDRDCTDSYYVTCKIRTVVDEATEAPCTTPTPDECTILWGENAFGISSKPGTCYQMALSTETWVDGAAYCQDKGWSLVDVEDEMENAELTEKYKKLRSSYAQYWIGQNERASPGTWQYVDATPGDSGVYVNWASGQPNGGGQQNCIMMDITQDGLWEDKACTERHYITCKKTPELNTTTEMTTVRDTTKEPTTTKATTTIQETTAAATTTLQETTAAAATTQQKTTAAATTLEATTEGATTRSATTLKQTTQGITTTETTVCNQGPNTRSGTFTFFSSDATCSSTPIIIANARDKMNCAQLCLSNGACFAFSFNASGSGGTCELCGNVSELKDLTFKAGGLFYQVGR